MRLLIAFCKDSKKGNISSSLSTFSHYKRRDYVFININIRISLFSIKPPA